MHRTEYLVDLLSAARIEAPAANYVQVQRVVLNGEVETAIFQHPPSTVTFPAIVIGRNATLKFGCGIREIAWPLIKDDVEFSISGETEAGRKLIFQTAISRRDRYSDCAWQRHELDLSQYEGKSTSFVLQTRAKRSAEYAWATWADPQIVHEVARKQDHRRDDQHPHVFLITADALPARHLRCYGSPDVETPHLDELAGDGVLFEQAWSQSCLTFGSYVSLLTGLHPAEHGVMREWQPFPVSRTDLPRTLAAHGYHTVLTVSSGEMSERNNYLEQIFQEVLPTFSNPTQDGEVTTRQFIKWFAQRPDKPVFSWLHYFDAHPPGMPPSPFNSKYYAGDPTNQLNTYRAQDVPKIRAVESLLVLQIGMPALERGEPVAEIVELLEDTAAVMKRESDFKPDLAVHILNLGERGMRGREQVEFGEWLAQQAHEIENGRASRELLKWLSEIAELLDPTEKDLLSWLRGVVDFRYPLAMYFGSVSYFDSHVGTLVSYLKERDIYDQSLIVVTAPHGEILAHDKVPYHHLLLTPDTIHVPLIMKIPSHLEHRRGSRLGGVFDLIDVFPTIIDMKGLNHNLKLSGSSRWKEIRRGTDIPPHDSFACGFHGLVDSVCRPPYLFSMQRSHLRAHTVQTLVGGAPEILYDAESGDVYSEDRVGVVDSLRESLKTYLAKELKYPER